MERVSRNKKSGGHKLFFRFLVPYIVVLLIPFMLGTIIYERTVELVKANSEESNIAILEQSIEVLEQRISEIEMIVSQHLVNKDVQNFLYKHEPFSSSNTYSILETRKHFYNYKTMNNFILDYFVFF